MEGALACFDLVQRFPDAVLTLVVTPRFLRQNPAAGEALRKCSGRLYGGTDAALGTLSDTETPQGILAIVRQPHWDESKALNQPRVVGIYGEQLRDPANVGTIIRTAAALNLTGLWLTPDSADWFAPKVVRATAGAILTLPVFRAAHPAAFADAKCALYAAVVPAPGTVRLREIRQIPTRLMIAVGNESRGLSAATLAASACRFSIPLARGVESLNVAATAAIASFYLSGLPTGA